MVNVNETNSGCVYNQRKEGKIIYSGNPEKPALDEIRDKQNPSLNKSENKQQTNNKNK